MTLTYPRKPTMRQRARLRPRNIVEVTRPAPVKGWVTRKNLSAMKPDEAILMDNVFPGETKAELRSGNTVYATGVGTGNVETLIPWQSPTDSKLLAACGGSIYDATSAGAATLLKSGFSGNYWSNTQVEITGSGVYTLLVDGTDTPQKFDGTAITDNTWTGFTGSTTANDMVVVHKHKFRVFAIEKDSLRFWYLKATQTIAGEMAPYDLGALCELGGYLMTMATWTRDGGSGVDDFAVFITSNGEVIIFQGTDPGDAAAWDLVGVFRIAPPLGRRCWIKFASDVVIATTDGMLPLSRVLSRDRNSQADDSISAQIAPTVTSVAATYKNTQGWQAVLYPRNRQMVINVPIYTSGPNQQWVMNTNTGGWCRFKDLTAYCFALVDDILYFGSSGGKVWKWDNGTSDNGNPITGLVGLAYDYMNDRGTLKKFDLVRPILQSDGNLTYGLKINTDFRDGIPDNFISGTGTGAPWDETAWDTAEWSDAFTTFQQWRSTSAIGRCAGLVMMFSTAANAIGFLGVDWRYERAGGLG